MWVPARFLEVDESIHARLLNWSEWIYERRPQGHCRSIEWRYIPERIADNDQRRAEQIEAFIDHRDALLVERTVSAPAFPLQERQLLKCHYVTRVRPEVCCRRHGIRFRDYGTAIARAAMILRNRLKNA